jgi:hypothetical protein
MCVLELWGALELRKPVDSNGLAINASDASSGPSVTHDIAIITDRLGEFLIPIRKKFERFSTKLPNVDEPFVTVENCLGLLLSLGLSGDPFNKASAVLKKSSVSHIDFNSFLSLYAECSGLAIHRNDFVEVGTWVPHRGGWEKVCE